MKVAVAISGAARSGLSGRDLRRNYLRLKENFPEADFFLGSWFDYREVMDNFFPEETVYLFKEPEMNYHPFLDIDRGEFETTKIDKAIRNAQNNPKFLNTSLHQTKQIIAHAIMKSIIPQDYDVLVRARFDTLTFEGADFTPFIEDAHKNKRAIGFATLAPGDFARTQEMKNNNYVKNFIFDQLIIHSNKIFNPGHVYALHRDKKLVAAEYGWWQVMSKDYGDNHRCINGWANPDKSVAGIYL